MSPQSLLVVTDRDGWRKEFPLGKNLIYIGCDPANDVVLDPVRGSGVASRQLQIVATQSDESRFLAINLGDAEVTLGSRAIPPRSAVSIADGDTVRLGDFLLVFRQGYRAAAPSPAFTGPVAVAPVGPPGGGAYVEGLGVMAAGSNGFGSESLPVDEGMSGLIGLSLSLRDTMIHPEKPVDGVIVVRNQGEQPGVQFKLEVLGYETTCFSLGAAPILFPNGEREVALRLTHPCRPSPAAGPYRVRVRATAPDAYPGESSTVSQVVEILPFFSHTLRMIP